MRRLIALTAATAILASCTVAQIQTNEAKVVAELQIAGQAILATVDAACGPFIAVAGAVGSIVSTTSKAGAVVGNLVKYGNSVCAVTGKVAPGATIDTSTATWVADITGGIKAIVALPTPPAPPASPSTPVVVPATVVTAGPAVTQPAPAPVTVGVTAAALPSAAPKAP